MLFLSVMVLIKNGGTVVRQRHKKGGNPQKVSALLAARISAAAYTSGSLLTTPLALPAFYPENDTAPAPLSGSAGSKPAGRR